MWRLFSFIVFVVLVVAVIGYFRGWLHFSTNQNDDNTSVRFNVNDQGLKRDAHRAEQKVKQGVQKIEKHFDRPEKPAEKSADKSAAEPAEKP